VLVRLVWMMFGNVALVVCAGLIVKRTAPMVMDAAFFGVAASLVLVRYIDIARLHGLTAEAKPATLGDWWRYSAKLAAFSLGLWALARFAATRGLT